MQLLPELLCSVPAQVHTRLGEWWLAGYRQPSVNKDLWIPGPALLILVEPLGFFGRWIKPSTPTTLCKYKCTRLSRLAFGSV